MVALVIWLYESTFAGFPSELLFRGDSVSSSIRANLSGQGLGVMENRFVIKEQSRTEFAGLSAGRGSGALWA